METIILIIGILLVAVCGYLGILFNQKFQISGEKKHKIISSILLLPALYILVVFFSSFLAYYYGNWYFTFVYFAEYLLTIYLCMRLPKKLLVINFKSKKTWAVIGIIFSILFIVFLFSFFGVSVLQYIGIY